MIFWVKKHSCGNFDKLGPSVVAHCVIVEEEAVTLFYCLRLAIFFATSILLTKSKWQSLFWNISGRHIKHLSFHLCNSLCARHTARGLQTCPRIQNWGYFSTYRNVKGIQMQGTSPSTCTCLWWGCQAAMPSLGGLAGSQVKNCSCLWKLADWKVSRSMLLEM